MKTKTKVKVKDSLLHSGDEVLFETHAYEKEVYLCSYHDGQQWLHVFLDSRGIHTRTSLKEMLHLQAESQFEGQTNIYDELEEPCQIAEPKAPVANVNSLMF